MGVADLRSILSSMSNSKSSSNNSNSGNTIDFSIENLEKIVLYLWVQLGKNNYVRQQFAEITEFPTTDNEQTENLYSADLLDVSFVYPQIEINIGSFSQMANIKVNDKYYYFISESYSIPDTSPNAGQGAATIYLRVYIIESQDYLTVNDIENIDDDERLIIYTKYLDYFPGISV